MTAALISIAVFFIVACVVWTETFVRRAQHRKGITWAD
jgi:hypothetical protein